MIKTPRTPALEDLLRITNVSDPVISAVGLQAVYVAGRAASDVSRIEMCLWMVPTDGSGPARPITSGPEDTSPRFTPDDSAIVFCRDIEGRPQLFLPAPG